MCIHSFLTAMKKCINTFQARQLFDKMPQRNSVLYNAMMRCHIQFQEPEHALSLFTEMLNSGPHKPDNFTFPFVLKACSLLSMLDAGRIVHSKVFVCGFESDIYVQNSLMAMYMSCNEMEAAAHVFYAIEERNVISWNTMISGYSRNGCYQKALITFDQMVFEGVRPDHATIVSVLPACADLKDLKWGTQVHKIVEEKGLGDHVSVKNALIDMYTKCDCLQEAKLVFDGMKGRDVVSWTTMIGGYAWNGDGRRALALCYPMQLEGVRPNSVTVAALLSGCVSLSSLKHGKSVHNWVIRFGLETDVVVETALIDMYAKCNRIDLSFCVFNKTSRRQTIPWNSMISGYVHNGINIEAIKLFKLMKMEDVDPDGATLISILPAYAGLADMNQANDIHGYIIRSGFNSRVEITTGLIDVYSKCGCLEIAHKLFNLIPKKDKDVIAWSALIASYGMHGIGKVAISLFYQMLQAGVSPNEVTFTSVLQACSHAGLVDEGFQLFKSIMQEHEKGPFVTDYHCTCMVDLLGRAGRLREAYELIVTMPYDPSYAVWGALLGGCVIHEDVELGEIAARQLFELEPDNTGNYVLLSKIYASARRWEDVESVRSIMSEMGLRKMPGFSAIEVTNVVNASSFNCS